MSEHWKATGCDKCQAWNVTAYRLDTGGDGDVFLCRPCWANEMHYRRERIADGISYEILPWPGSRRPHLPASVGVRLP